MNLFVLNASLMCEIRFGGRRIREYNIQFDSPKCGII